MLSNGIIFKRNGIEHKAAIEKLVVESSPRKTFLLLIFFSSIIATLGLLNENTAVVIGAMLVAPLLWPVLGVAMGLLTRDFQMMKLSFVSIILSVMVGITTSILITFFYLPLETNVEAWQYARHTYMILVAVASGAAAAMSISYQSVREAFAGIAISVALIPPLVTIGIGLGASDWLIMRKAAELFLINLSGIIITSYLVFWMLGFKGYTHALQVAVKKEEKSLKS